MAFYFRSLYVSVFGWMDQGSGLIGIAHSFLLHGRLLITKQSMLLEKKKNSASYWNNEIGGG